MSKALYISSFIPDNLAGHAGAQLAYHNLKNLQKKYDDVDIIVCSTEQMKKTEFNLKFFNQSKFSLILGWLFLIFNFIFHGIWVWHILNTRANIKYILTVRKALKENLYDEVFFDFTQSIFPFVKDLKILEDTKISIFIHDVYWQKISRLSSFKQKIYSAIYSQESIIFNNVNEVITVSSKDAKLLNTLYGVKDVIVNEFIPPQWCANVKPNLDSGRVILFFANFNRNENLEALEWFIENCLKQLVSEFSDFKLILLGMGSEKFIFLSNTYSNHIEIIGYVEDPSGYFSRANYSIAPLKYGAGIKYKVLESLAAGVPVVGTSVGIEGVPKNDKIHLAEREFFLDALKLLLK